MVPQGELIGRNGAHRTIQVAPGDCFKSKRERDVGTFSVILDDVDLSEVHCKPQANRLLSRKSRIAPGNRGQHLCAEMNSLPGGVSGVLLVAKRKQVRLQYFLCISDLVLGRYAKFAPEDREACPGPRHTTRIGYLLRLIPPSR